MNWFKKQIRYSWNRGIPIMDEYARQSRPPSSQYKKDPRSLVDAKPLFGGEKRKGYPMGVSSVEEDDYSQVKKLPSEPVLMDQDPPTGEGANDERFVDDIEKMPIKNKTEPRGPHNMQSRITDKNIYDFISEKARIKRLRL